MGFEPSVGLERSAGASLLKSPGVPESTEDAPPDGCQDGCLLMEVEHAEPVGDEVQASEEEGLGWLEDGRSVV